VRAARAVKNSVSDAAELWIAPNKQFGLKPSLTWNITDMDKINTVSSQAVLEMSSFSVDTRSMSSLPLVNSLVKNWLFKTTPRIDQLLLQFIHTMDLSVVDTMLHDSPDLVVHRLRSGLFGGHRLGVRECGISWCSSSTVACAWHSVPVHCPAGTRSRYQTLCVSLAAVYNIIMMSRSSIEELSKRYHQNFLLCNDNEITACMHIYSTFFVKKCVRLHFSM